MDPMLSPLQLTSSMRHSSLLYSTVRLIWIPCSVFYNWHLPCAILVHSTLLRAWHESHAQPYSISFSQKPILSILLQSAFDMDPMLSHFRLTGLGFSLHLGVFSSMKKDKKKENWDFVLSAADAKKKRENKREKREKKRKKRRKFFSRFHLFAIISGIARLSILKEYNRNWHFFVSFVMLYWRNFLSYVMIEQGRIHGYPSRVRVSRGSEKKASYIFEQGQLCKIRP